MKNSGTMIIILNGLKIDFNKKFKGYKNDITRF